jgi:N-acetylglutamate synthase-like GNAT family acetyltransferase
MNDDFLISTDKSKLDIKMIQGFFESSYWANDRKIETTRKAIENSLCFGIYEKATGRQIGFARAVTDYATFAWIADVFIIEEQRGKGLSKILMDYILAHPDLKTVKRFLLATRNAHSLYEKFNFKPVKNPKNHMERTSE